MTTENGEQVAASGGGILGDRGIRELDVFLRALVSFCNEQGAGLSLTVHSGGTIVSGTLISDTEYYNLLADNVRTALPGDESAEAFAGAVDYWARLPAGDVAEEEPAGVAETSAREHWRARHLHMKTVAIGSSLAQLSPTQGLPWRGRLSSVDGWMLGSFEPCP